MRSSILPFLSLFVATFLLIAEISISSPTTPTDHDRHENLINAPKARSLDTPDFHAVTRMAAPDGANNKHLQRRRDILNPSNHPSPALMQRHNHIMDRLRLHAGDSSLAKRSLAGDLIVMGFQLIWEHADIIVGSSLAYYRTSELYRNITIRAGAQAADRTMLTYIITYGGMRLVLEAAYDAVTGIAVEMAAEFPNGFGGFVKDFAETMLLLTEVAVLIPFIVLAYSAKFSFWITMTIVQIARDHGDPVNLIGGGP